MADGQKAVPNNLPVSLTSFIGREREINEIEQLVGGSRLLTLTGAGGCGKSRLALQVASGMLEEFHDGVWLVELASLVDPALVHQAVASILDVPEQPGRPLAHTLEAYLRSKSLLLLLDNCEHLITAAAQLVATLLRGCPNLRVLATSREALGIVGELTYRVPSLTVPNPNHTPPAETLNEYEAIRLFVDRAALSQPGFGITNRNAAALVRICSQLDGIPLAIELAAARVKAVPIDVIASRLDDRFRLLVGGNRAALPRHQTLRAAMDWSYDLLSEQEQSLLRRLSVFAGGFTLEAAEMVCAGEGIDKGDILNLLTCLVEKSLVLLDEREGHDRYRLLETVRQYGQGGLAKAGEVDTLRNRHRDFFLKMAEGAEPKLLGADQAAWLTRLEKEHDNLRAALEWSKIDKGGAEAGLRLAGALHEFWHRRGYWNEGLGWTEATLARSDEAPSVYLPKALHGAARFMRRLGDYERAAPLCKKGLALCRELGDKKYGAWFLVHFGIVAMNESNFAQATELFQEAFILCRESQDKWWIWMGLNHLAEAALRQGNYAQATSSFSENLARAREVGDEHIIAYTLRYQGEVWLHQGNYEQAAACYTEGLTASCAVGSRRETEECIDGLAQLACAKGSYEQAARLFGVAEALRAALGLHPDRFEQALHDQSLAFTRAALGEAAFAAQFAEGQAAPLEQAIKYALATTEAPPPSDKRTEKSAADPRASLLTPREREVAVLVAHGLTNREIAAKLVVTPRTAETHVQNILNKLGLTSRVQIATWAVDCGLHAPSAH